MNHARWKRIRNSSQKVALGLPGRPIPGRANPPSRAGWSGSPLVLRIALRTRRSMMNAIMFITVPRRARSNRLATRRRTVTTWFSLKQPGLVPGRLLWGLWPAQQAGAP
jgi:hypothetical protein